MLKHTAGTITQLAAVVAAFACTAPAAQEAERSFRPWTTRVSTFGTWSPHERFWVNSAGTVAYENAGIMGTMPCVAEASAETVAAIERALSSFLTRDIGESAGSTCRDDPMVAMFVAHSPGEGTGVEFTERVFSDVPDCRSRPVDEAEESVATLVRRAAAELKAACPVPVADSQISTGSWTVRMNLRVSPPEPNQTVDNETRRYETYWINSRGDVAVANLGYGLEVPCVGAADAETVAKIEADVTQLLAQPPGEPGGSTCPDTEYVYLEIASAGSGMNPQVQIGFAENPRCRRRPISQEMDSILAGVREAGAAARAVCPATP